jgi:hypothetical protein
MRTALASIVALVLLCLGPTAVLADDEADVQAVPATYFTGTFERVLEELPDPVMNPETGMLEVRGGKLEYAGDIGDPRVAPTYLVDPFHMDIDPVTGAGRMWGTGHSVSETGAFEGPIRGFHYPITEEISGFTASGWLPGSGEYEGLTYFYRGTFDGEESFMEGLIYEGEAPPLE